MRLVAITFIACLLLAPLTRVAGHSGGTNAAGCHTNRRSGDYHCHSPKTGTPTINYCHVVNGEHRCGYALSTCNDLVAQLGGDCVRP